MLALVRWPTAVLCLSILPAFSWTVSYTSTAQLPPSQSPSMLANTLLLGSAITWLIPDRLDPEPFKDHAPEPMDFTFDLEPTWLRILKKILEKTNISEKEIVKELLAQYESKQKKEIYIELTSDQPFAPSKNSFVNYGVPGTWSLGGKDEKNETSKSDQTGGKKKGEKRDEKSASSTSSQSQSSVSPTAIPEVIGELSVQKPEDQSLAEKVIDLYQTRQSRKIGHGSYSRVYKIEESGQLLVIKIPSLPHPKRLKSDHVTESETRRTLAQTRNEIDQLKKLQHNNIVRMRAYAEIHLPQLGLTYLLILDFAGKSLGHYLAKEHYESIRNHVFTIAHSVLEALTFIHNHGMVLGDMNSENILVRFKGDRLQVRLIDLATCQTQEQRLLLGIDDIGTQGWLAPECIKDRRIVPHSFSQASDRFGLGIMAALLSGIHRQRYYGDDFKYVRKNVPHQVNEVLLKSVSYRNGKFCQLSREQLATGGVPADDTVTTITSDRGFMKLIAILTTRPDSALRAEDHLLQHLFTIYSQNQR